MNSIVKTPIYVKGKVIGKVVNGTFCKVVSGSRHFLRSPKAIAQAVTTLADIRAAEGSMLQVTDIETGLIYTTTMTHFYQYAIDIQSGGNEPQKALPLEYWDVTGGKVAHQIEKNKKTKREPAPDEEPEYTAALALPPMQLHFDIFRKLRQ